MSDNDLGLMIGDRVDRASATETVDLNSTPHWFKLKTINIDIHIYVLDVQQLKGTL